MRWCAWSRMGPQVVVAVRPEKRHQGMRPTVGADLVCVLHRCLQGQEALVVVGSGA